MNDRERITENEEDSDVPYATTSAESAGDDMLSRRPGTGNQTPGEGGTTANHAAGAGDAVSEGLTAPVGARDAEEADDMPGGAAAYAGRGDTGTGREAPGGAQGYASDHLPDDADEMLEED